MQFGVGDDEYLRKLRAEVKPPILLGSPKQPVQQMKRKPSAGIKPKHVIVGLISVAAIISAIIGHAMASGNAIKAGDCVVTSPNAVTDWDIKKVSCSSPPQAEYYQVASVLSGSNANCYGGYTTFNQRTC